MCLFVNRDFGIGYKPFFVLLLSLTFCVANGFGQTAKEIIQHVIESLGGEDQIRKINTVVKKGFINIGNDSLKITVTQANGKGKKTEMVLNGLHGYEIINNEHGWIYMPFEGQTENEEMAPDIYAGKKIDLDLQGILLDFDQKGFTATRLENEIYEGKEFLKIKLFKEPGIEFHFLIDPETSLVAQRIEIKKVEEKLVMRQVRYGDYRKVGKVSFPFLEENQYGAIIFYSIKTGMRISDSAFLPD
jgi:hypothetical protein